MAAEASFGIKDRSFNMSSSGCLLLAGILATALAPDASESVCGRCVCISGENFLSVDCSNRDLVDIPATIPWSVTRLSLSHNRISRVTPGVFKNMTNMTALNLAYNQIVRIENDSFDGLDSLQELDLNANPIPYNESGFWLTSLRRLSKLSRLFLLTDECPAHFPEAIIEGMSSLIELALFMPPVGSFGDAYRTLKSLQTLHLSSSCPTPRTISNADLDALSGLPIRGLSFRNGQISDIDPTALLPLRATLRKLDLSCNRIKNIEKLLSALSHFPLQTLLMDSSIGEFLSFKINERTWAALRSMNLSRLTLAWNNFLDIDLTPGFKVVEFPNLEYLRVGYNQIALTVSKTEDILIALFKLLLNVRVFEMNGLLKFYDNHDRVLDCYRQDILFSENELDWQKDQLNYPPPEVPEWFFLLVAILRFQKGILTLPPRLTRLYAQDLGQITERMSCNKLPFEIHRDNNLQRVDGSFTTMPRVDCIVRGLASLVWLDAEQVQLQSWAPSLFSNISAPLLRHVILRGNDLGEFIATSQQAPLNGTFNVTHVDLSANKIYYLPNDFLRYSFKLKQLNLSFNSLDIWNTSIGTSPNLELLDLTRNYIKAIPDGLLTEFDEHRLNINNFTIIMEKNDFECYACSNVALFRWYLETEVKVDGMSCVDGGARHPVGGSLLGDLKWQCWGRNVLLAGVSVLTFISVLAALGQTYRWTIRYFYHRLRRCFMNVDPFLPGEGVLVYLSHHSDEIAKANEITRYLTNKMGLIGVTTRASLEPGRWQLDTIALQVDSCDFVILLISPQCLSDQIAEFEFYMSLEKGFQRILPILTSENLPLEMVPMPLRKLLNMNNYLTWPDEAHGTAAGIDTGDENEIKDFFIVFEACVENMVKRTGAFRAAFRGGEDGRGGRDEVATPELGGASCGKEDVTVAASAKQLLD